MHTFQDAELPAPISVEDARPAATIRRLLHRLNAAIRAGTAGYPDLPAHTLLDRYGSIENIMQANEQDLAQAPGVVKDAAQRIRWMVNDPGVEYG